MRLFNRYYSRYDLALPFGDVGITVAAIVLTQYLVVSAELLYAYQQTVLAAWLTLAVLISFYYADLYDIDQALSQRELALRFINGFVVSCLLMAALSYSIPETGLKKTYLIQTPIMGIGLFTWRLAFSKILKLRKVRGTIAIIGMQKVGRLVAEELFRKKHLGLKVACFVGPQRGEVTLSYGNPRKITIPVVSPESTLPLVRGEGVSRILIAGPER